MKEWILNERVLSGLEGIALPQWNHIFLISVNRETGEGSVLVYFSHCCEQIAGRSYLWEGGRSYLGSWIEATVHHEGGHGRVHARRNTCWDCAREQPTRNGAHLKSLKACCQ